MRIKKIYILVLVVSVTLFSSCGKESSCLKNTGKNTLEMRSLTSLISKIKIEDNINLILTQGNQAELKVEAGENLLPFINTGVNGETLEISNRNKCNFLRNYDKPINIYLTVSNLTEISYQGKGEVSSVGSLNFPKLTIETKTGTGKIDLNLISDEIRLISHSGATEFIVAGTSNKLFVFSGASTWCYLSSLTANDVHVNNAGVGDIMVNANNTLLIELSSLGNIIYTGTPAITISVNTGSGQLIKR
jgi:hypothetical protein